MFYKKIVCLAVSRKWGGKCVAGKDIRNGEWIRPISNREHEEITDYDMSYENKKMPELLDIIKIPFKKRRPSDYQPENILIDSEIWWKYRSKYSKDKLDKLCDDPDEVFVNEKYWTDKISPEVLIESGIKKSLLFIKPESFKILRSNYVLPYGGIKKKVRAVFVYKGIFYNLGITDPLIESKYFSKKVGDYSIGAKDIYLCISLGEPWENNGYCYKLVASVIY